jgi:putative sterol carrier protein
VIEMKASDFVDLAVGRLDGTQAFMNGRLRLHGDMAKAMRLQQILQ